MKREDLQKIEGLTKEQIEGVMELHKGDAESFKEDLKAKNTEITTRDAKIEELAESVKKFEGVDLKKLQEDVKNWETKYKTDLANEKKNGAIKIAITQSKARNEKALMALLDTDIVKVNDDGTVTGLKEQLENVKKDNPYLFEEENKNPEDVNLGGDHNKNPQEKEVTWDNALDEHYN